LPNKQKVQEGLASPGISKEAIVSIPSLDVLFQLKY
jgi:hypothetical protein